MTTYLNIREGSEKRKIYEICDTLYEKRGKIPLGREVVDLYVAAGGNEGTGFTQYSRWKKAVKQASAKHEVATSSEDGAFHAVNVRADGVLTLPSSISAAMGVAAGGTIYVRVKNGTLTAVSPMVALEAVKAALAESGGSLVDELIRERRAEANGS